MPSAAVIAMATLGLDFPRSERAVVGVEQDGYERSGQTG